MSYNDGLKNVDDLDTGVYYAELSSAPFSIVVVMVRGESPFKQIKGVMFGSDNFVDRPDILTALRERRIKIIKKVS